MEERSCNDICCCVFFILFTILFIVLGFVFIGNANFADLKNMANGKTSVNTTNQVDLENLKPAIPTIVGMIGLAIVLSIIFMCMLSRFPKCMFYTMLILTAILLIALIIAMFAAGSIVGGVLLLIVLLIYGCFLCCCREEIRVGIVLLETSANFLLEKPSVYCAPIFITFFVIIF